MNQLQKKVLGYLTIHSFTSIFFHSFFNVPNKETYIIIYLNVSDWDHFVFFLLSLITLIFVLCSHRLKISDFVLKLDCGAGAAQMICLRITVNGVACCWMSGRHFYFVYQRRWWEWQRNYWSRCVPFLRLYLLLPVYVDIVLRTSYYMIFYNIRGDGRRRAHLSRKDEETGWDHCAEFKRYESIQTERKNLGKNTIQHF